MDFSTHLFKVHFTMKLTYRTPPHDDDDTLQGGDPEITESGGDPDVNTFIKTQWDDDCPWTEWYSAEDPVKGNLYCQYIILILFVPWHIVRCQFVVYLDSNRVVLPECISLPL